MYGIYYTVEEPIPQNNYRGIEFRPIDPLIIIWNIPKSDPPAHPSGKAE